VTEVKILSFISLLRHSRYEKKAYTIFELLYWYFMFSSLTYGGIPQSRQGRTCVPWHTKGWRDTLMHIKFVYTVSIALL